MWITFSMYCEPHLPCIKLAIQITMALYRSIAWEAEGQEKRGGGGEVNSMGNTPLIPCFEPYNPGYWSLQNIQKINQWSQGVWLVVYCIYVCIVITKL